MAADGSSRDRPDLRMSGEGSQRAQMLPHTVQRQPRQAGGLAQRPTLKGRPPHGGVHLAREDVEPGDGEPEDRIVDVLEESADAALEGSGAFAGESCDFGDAQAVAEHLLEEEAVGVSEVVREFEDAFGGVATIERGLTGVGGGVGVVMRLRGCGDGHDGLAPRFNIL